MRDAIRARSTPSSLATGLLALAIVLLLARTRLASISAVVALAVPTLLTLGSDTIARVDDIGEIPRGVPLPHLPDLSLLDVNLIVGALSVAAIVLVQGAGVAEAAPNTTGASDANRDFVAQGVANVASGMFRGQPVGGSVGATALNVTSGARSRWAAIFIGLWMIVVAGAAVRRRRPGRHADAGGDADRRRGIIHPDPVDQDGAADRPHVADRHDHDVPGNPRPAGRRRGRSRRGPFAPPPAQPRGDRPARRRALPVLRRTVFERPAPASVQPRCVTLLDIYGSLFYAGAKHARRPAARSTGGRTGRRDPPPRPHRARRHVVRDPGRLRAAARGGRWAPVPERRRSRPARAVPTYAPGRSTIASGCTRRPW